jgi:hypothetical protein
MAYWTISNTSTSRTEGNDLNGLDIEEVFNENNQLTGYQLVDPNATDPQEAVLDTTNQTSPPLEFNNVEWDGQTWNIHVPAGLTPDEDGSGTWHLHGHVKRTGGQDGDFTAQAGSGLGEEPYDTASSAKA